MRTLRRTPRRPQYDLRVAVERAGLRIRACQVEFWNPHATGKRGKAHGAPQWIDVAAEYSGHLLTLDVLDNNEEFADRFEKEKRAGLQERGIPYLCVRHGGAKEMQVEITIWLRLLELGFRD